MAYALREHPELKTCAAVVVVFDHGCRRTA
jgi:hypothetical protein